MGVGVGGSAWIPDDARGNPERQHANLTGDQRRLLSQQDHNIAQKFAAPSTTVATATGTWQRRKTTWAELQEIRWIVSLGLGSGCLSSAERQSVSPVSGGNSAHIAPPESLYPYPSTAIPPPESLRPQPSTNEKKLLTSGKFRSSLMLLAAISIHVAETSHVE